MTLRNIIYGSFISAALASTALSASAADGKPVRLSTGGVELQWTQTPKGYLLESVRVNGNDGWTDLAPAMYQHHVLYSPVKPETTPQTLYDAAGKEISFPDPQYRYIIPSWQQNTTATALNRAGESLVFLPSEAGQYSEKRVKFIHEDGGMKVVETWEADPHHATDIKVTVTLYPKKDGWWSLSTPSIAVMDKYDFTWATVPGIFQGNTLNSDFVRAYAYGQGVPDIPVVARERTASTLAAIITGKKGITAAVTATPGTGRDPWEKDKKTHSAWRLGLSVMNRDGEFTPTLYHPVLGEDGSFAHAGDSLSFSFICTFQDAGWYTVMKHSVNDIYRFSDALKLKRTERSLTQRLYDMYAYLTDDSTSMWRNCRYKGVTIGAQDYRGGVYGSEKDAMKNSDYGAMWMLAEMTGDPKMTEDRLPYALNFKIMQQDSEQDSLYGSSAGQYYLHKSCRFTEEWGPYTEPIATTYYMLMDMGNILLFESGEKELKHHMALAADRLLKWMHPDGHWEVAYDNATMQPMFTDVKDLRPTFYGLLTAYQVLGNKKYLEAARKGADWYIENAVDKGHFLGVCGDTRFAPDFATAQSIQALLEMYKVTGDEKYREAAISAAEIYTASIYTHPIPTREKKTVKGIEREDWEISEAGLGFEHGGVIGSANHRGPILLASHAGMFVRLYSMTSDSLFLNMARAAAIGRDAFVDMKTGVASYYWDSMNNGAGPFPHHAWWQVGWITDYLMSEADLRSGGEISFPRGFITPKVGPHQTYGFAPGKVYGTEADLIMRPGLVRTDNPYIEYITALNRKKRTLFVILMNNDDENRSASVEICQDRLSEGKKSALSPETREVSIAPYGLDVLELKY